MAKKIPVNVPCSPVPCRCIFPAVALALAVTMVWQAGGLLRRELLFTAAETEVSFWGRGNYQPDLLARARIGHSLDTLLAESPGHPGYLTLAASYYDWLAYWSAEAAIERDFNWRALGAQYAAQLSRPAYRQGWASMLVYATRADGMAASHDLAQQRLAALQPGTAPGSTGVVAH